MLFDIQIVTLKYSMRVFNHLKNSITNFKTIKKHIPGTTVYTMRDVRMSSMKKNDLEDIT